MPPNLTTLIHRIRRLAEPTAMDSDADLLGRFARSRDESAFAALVARHGPMVFGVCRRILHDAHAAEDAAQATFLVLARRAGSVGQPDYLTGWLHGVAYRIASKARFGSLRRSRVECVMDADRLDERSDPLAEVSARELLEVLETEVRGLPEAYRLPLVLCCLEGLSQEEAAVRLGCTPGSVRGRLERGRKRLHERLVRRGLTLPAALAAVLASRSSVSAALVRVTVRGAVEFVAGGNGVVSQQVIALANGGLKAMFWTKIKVALVVLAATGLFGSGAGWVMTGGGESSSGTLVSPVVAAAEPEQKPKPKVGDDKTDKEDKAKEEKANQERNLLLVAWIRKLEVLTAQAEEDDAALSAQLVRGRFSLAELEERLREQEADMKATRSPGGDEIRLVKEEDRLRADISNVKKLQEDGLKRGNLLAQLEKKLEETSERREQAEDRRRKSRQMWSQRLLETKKQVIGKEEALRQLERKRDRLRQETDRKREAALDRIQRLEDGAVTDAPDRVQKTMERRLDAIQRELTELRRELRRQKSGPKE